MFFQKFLLIACGTYIGAFAFYYINQKYQIIKNPFRLYDPEIEAIVAQEKLDTYAAQTRLNKVHDQITTKYRTTSEAVKLSERLNIGVQIKGQGTDLDEAMRQKASVGTVVYTKSAASQDEQKTD